LEKAGVEDSVAAIDFSIANNYHGIIFREQRGNNGNYRNQPAAKDRQCETDRLVTEANVQKLDYANPRPQ
jgi:hypothetical protein